MSAAVTPVHVSNIAPALDTQGPNWGMDATITVQDDTNSPVSGITVDVTFSGFVSESGSGSTNGSGDVTISSLKAKGSGTITVTVDNLSGTGYNYDSGANVETSDSLSN